jgi:hypothetical protein
MTVIIAAFIVVFGIFFPEIHHRPSLLYVVHRWVIAAPYLVAFALIKFRFNGIKLKKRKSAHRNYAYPCLAWGFVATITGLIIAFRK